MCNGTDSCTLRGVFEPAGYVGISSTSLLWLRAAALLWPRAASCHDTFHYHFWSDPLTHDDTTPVSHTPNMEWPFLHLLVFIKTVGGPQSHCSSYHPASAGVCPITVASFIFLLCAVVEEDCCLLIFIFCCCDDWWKNDKYFDVHTERAGRLASYTPCSRVPLQQPKIEICFLVFKDWPMINKYA